MLSASTWRRRRSSSARALQQRSIASSCSAVGRLPPLLGRLRPATCCSWHGDREWARYESVYFDTPERELFHAHRRGRRPRYKIRIRHHVDRRLSFLEIKRKERSGRTMKTRLALPFGAGRADGSANASSSRRMRRVAAARLVPCVSISFLRLTLVGVTRNERLTLDRELRLSDDGRVEELPRVVVAEVKQARHATTGAVAALLRAAGARSGGQQVLPGDDPAGTRARQCLQAGPAGHRAIVGMNNLLDVLLGRLSGGQHGCCWDGSVSICSSRR